MLHQLPHTWWLIAAITVVSVALVLLGGRSMLDVTRSTRTTLIINFLVGSIVGGLIAIQAYLWVDAHWPDTASTAYLRIALGATAILTVGAIAMYWIVKDIRIVSIWIVLNLVWGLGYGLLIPRLVTF